MVVVEAVAAAAFLTPVVAASCAVAVGSMIHKERRLQVFLAIYHDDMSALRNALQKIKGSDFTYLTTKQETPLLYSCKRGNEQAVKLLIEFGASVRYENNLLGSAFLSGNASLVRLLLKHGADLNGEERIEGRTFAAAVFQSGRVDMVKTLLDQGVCPNFRSSPLDDSPLVKAIKGGDTEMVKMLLHYGASIHPDRTYAPYPLEEAIASGQVDIIRALLDCGASPNACLASNSSMPPIFQSCEANQIDVVKLLLEYGADVHAQHKQKNLFWYARSADMVNMLIDNGLDPSKPISMMCWDEGRTLLHFTSSVDVARALLRRGVDLNILDGKNNTPLHWIRDQNFRSRSLVLRELILQGADVTAEGRFGTTPFEQLCADESATEEDVRVFLRAGAASRSVPLFQSELQSALRVGNANIIKALVDNGADICHPFYYGSNAVHKMVESLDDATANLVLSLVPPSMISAKDEYGQTPLHLAILKYREEHLRPEEKKAALRQVRKLIAEGGEDSINVENDFGMTPFTLSFSPGKLHRDTYDCRCYGYPDEELLRLLVDKGADVNAITPEKGTILHWLATSDCEWQVRLASSLIDDGADMEIRDCSGRTALHVAISYRSEAFVLALMASGALRRLSGAGLLAAMVDACRAENWYVIRVILHADRGISFQAKDSFGRQPLQELLDKWSKVPQDIMFHVFRDIPFTRWFHFLAPKVNSTDDRYPATDDCVIWVKSRTVVARR